MNKLKILIIDDDPKLNNLLMEYLIKFGFEAISAIHPKEGLKLLKSAKPDLIILDVMMPDIDGFELCKEVRKDNKTPIIMLTARGDVTDRVVGLELGADDYVAKPFEPRELVARIQTVLRRTTAIETNSGEINCGELKLYPEKYILEVEGEHIEVSTLEFDLLYLFVKNTNKVLTREQLMDNLHGVDWSAFDRSIDVLISRLRQKLNDNPKNPKFIKTIRGMGYKFVGG